MESDNHRRISMIVRQLDCSHGIARLRARYRFLRTPLDDSFEQTNGLINLAWLSGRHVRPSCLEISQSSLKRTASTMLPEVSHPPIAADKMRAEVIVDETPMTGRFNMAMDAAMLELGATRDIAVIRIYRWSEPTVSVGYFQGSSAQPESPFSGLPSVRRLSGGGAILHDLEITYSCILPASHPVRQDPSELYTIIHRRLIKLLRECGAECMLRSDFDADQLAKLEDAIASGNTNPTEEPFLCFLRANPKDIVHESGIKIVGSAQRRRKGITLQHGSILISASDVCPGVKGILQLTKEFDTTQFSSRVPGMIADSIAHEWTIRSYSDSENAICSEFLSNPA